MPEAGDESDGNDDWMFKTFSKNKKRKTKKTDTKGGAALDPFANID